MRDNDTIHRTRPAFGPAVSAEPIGGIVAQELSPVEELVLDTLTARLRLGEAAWTFDVRLAPVLADLASRGLVDVQDVLGPTVLAGLTAAGRAVAMDETYAVPRARDAIGEAGELDALDDLTVVRCADGVAWQKHLTIEGSRWFSTIPGPDSSFGPCSSRELLARRGEVEVVSLPAA